MPTAGEDPVALSTSRPMSTRSPNSTRAVLGSAVVVVDQVSRASAGAARASGVAPSRLAVTTPVTRRLVRMG